MRPAKLTLLSEADPARAEKTITAVLLATGGNVRAAARELGVSHTVLYRIMGKRRSVYRRRVVEARLADE